MTGSTVDPPAVAAPPTPPARRLRRELRRLRRGHSDRTVWQSVEQVYVGLFAVAVFGAMASGVLNQVWSDLTRCSGADCVLARRTLPPALALTVLGLAVRMLLALGPVVASRATGTWLLDTPLDRRALLARPLGVLLLGGLVGGAVLFGGAAGLAVGDQAPALAGLGAWLGAAAGMLAAATAAAAQPTPGGRRAVGAAGGLLVLAGCALAAAVVFGGPVRSTSWARSAVLAPAALGTTLAAVLLTVVAYRGLAGLSRHRLVAGGELLSGLGGAAVSLDVTFVSDLLVARRFRTLGARRPRPGLGRSGLAVALREVARWTRTPRILVVPIVLLLVPYVVSWSGLPSALAVAVAVAGYLACRPLAGGLHAVSRSRGLRRTFPMTDPALRLALVTPAWVAGGAWVAATLPALPPRLQSPAGWLALTAVIAAGVVRSATREPISFDGPLISSPMGAMPAGFVGSLVRGPDMLVIGLIPAVFGLPAVLTVGLPLGLVLFGLYRGPKKLTAEANKARPAGGR